MQIPQGSIFPRPFYVGATGLTLGMTISKAGAAFATAAGSVAEISGGWYVVNLSAVDTGTVGALAYLPTGSGLPPIAGLPVDQVVAVASLAFPIVVE